MAEEYTRTVHIPDDRADSEEVASIVQAAAPVRNGWKIILGRCAPAPKRTRRAMAENVALQGGSQAKI